MTAPESRDAQSGVAEVLAETLLRHCIVDESDGGGFDDSSYLCCCDFVAYGPDLCDAAETHAAHVAAMQAAALGPVLAAERAKALREAADEAEALRSFAHGKNPTSEAHLIGYGTARRVIVRLLRDRADREQS